MFARDRLAGLSLMCLKARGNSAHCPHSVRIFEAGRLDRYISQAAELAEAVGINEVSGRAPSLNPLRESRSSLSHFLNIELTSLTSISRE